MKCVHQMRESCLYIVIDELLYWVITNTNIFLLVDKLIPIGLQVNPLLNTSESSGRMSEDAAEKRRKNR